MRVLLCVQVRVMSTPVLVSTCLQLVMVVVYQLAPLWMLRAQPGYVRTQGGKEVTQVTVRLHASTLCHNQ